MFEFSCLLKARDLKDPDMLDFRLGSDHRSLKSSSAVTINGCPK